MYNKEEFILTKTWELKQELISIQTIQCSWMEYVNHNEHSKRIKKEQLFITELNNFNILT